MALGLPTWAVVTGLNTRRITTAVTATQQQLHAVSNLVLRFEASPFMTPRSCGYLWGTWSQDRRRPLGQLGVGGQKCGWGGITLYRLAELQFEFGVFVEGECAGTVPLHDGAGCLAVAW